jgi:nicotinate-nucleotide adenylyltransferase
MKVDMPLIELSSTELRKRAATGQSLRFRMPRSVEQYIQSHQLYRPKS